MLRSLLFAGLLSFPLFACATTEPAKVDSLDVQSLRAVSDCAGKTVISFVDKSTYPPASPDRMRQYCKGQADGIKCVRDLSKNTTGILRRGLQAFVASRQRYHRRFCNNVEGEQTRRWMRDLKCVMDKRLPAMSRQERRIIYLGGELVRRNLNDSSLELKYICCTLLDYRRALVEACEPECAASRATVEDMVQQSMSNELSLVCDDDEKLTKQVCPTLEPIEVPKSLANQTYVPPAQTFLYLFTTLGEPAGA